MSQYSVVMHGCVDAAKLFCGSFWMAWFGSSTPKRHTLWSNDDFIEELCREAGQLRKDDKKRLCTGEPLGGNLTFVFIFSLPLFVSPS